MDHRTGSFGYVGMLLFSLFAVLPVVKSLEILDIEGPSVVVNGSTSQIVLDCDYDITEYDKSGLVVKWYFNRQPFPVYQWIPSKDPQDLGILKGRLNLNYEVSEDQFSKHRALAIVNPTTDLTGEYTCLISSFESEAFKRKSLIVYAPAEDLSMTYSKPSEDSVIITCRAGGIFPAPNIAISRSSSSSKEFIESAKVESQLHPEYGYYNISIEIEVSDYELDSETMFECVLTIPGTEYRVQEKILYFPGHLTTPTPEEVEPEDVEELLEEIENTENDQSLEEEGDDGNSRPHTAESVSSGERVLSSLSFLSVLASLHLLFLH